MSERKNEDPFRGTLNLPKTKFSMKANLLQMEPEYQKRWEKLDVYTKARQGDHPAGKFVFHDGPPYANGNIHLGHLLNKVLKDFVVRSHTMLGYDVHFVPGWDCHGLPIEHQVMKELGAKAKTMTTGQIRNRCKSYAQKYVKLQTKQMQRLGTQATYDKPYLTMTPQYEAATLDVFAQLVTKGLVYRDLKPVHWSIANQTALADAELEYYDRDDVSVFVAFDIKNPQELPASLSAPSDQAIRLLIWTTTPWTLPANLAVAAAEKESYGLYEVVRNDKIDHVVMAETLHEKVFAMAGCTSIRHLGSCPGAQLTELRYTHPFCDREGPVLLAKYVTVDDGTGLVHTAPGHGVDDYQTGLKAGLDIYCPVKGDGTFDETAPKWLQGQSVWEGNALVIEHLRNSGHLFHDYVFNHSYPHDWRSKTPTIFRATQQWFIGVDTKLKNEAHTLREMARKACEDTIDFVPSWGKSRLQGMLESRPDWCVSRQRSWGLPIPAFIRDDEEALLTPLSVQAVAQVVRREGADIWFRQDPEYLLADYDYAQDPDAPAWLKQGGAEAIAQLRKSSDIFDVWFESGSSWNAVMRERDIGYPIDLYLEGSDQHRGWFQLSLLPALGATGAPPFKKLLTHGFVVDAQGRKMSKSVGNVIGVEELLGKYGADICRWWVVSLNYANDVKADWAFFETASEEYRKIRNTLRFVLGNVSDFDPVKDSYTFSEDDRVSMDAWVMEKLDVLIEEVTEAYRRFHYRPIRDALFKFCNETLSAVYFAAIKDRLYCDAKDAPRRRRTQSALFEIADALLRLFAPIMVHSMEQAYLSLHRQDPRQSEHSIHLKTFPKANHYKADARWQQVMDIRTEVLKNLELAKEKDINNPLDAGIEVQLKDSSSEDLAPFIEDLTDLCGVSRLRFTQGEAMQVLVEDLREAPRCIRSRKRDKTVKKRDNGHWLSDRDALVVQEDTQINQG
jgi:isoleucyl-tRNA synthetase